MVREISLRFIEVWLNVGLVLSLGDLLKSFNNDLSFFFKLCPQTFVTSESSDFKLAYPPNKTRDFP